MLITTKEEGVEHEKWYQYILAKQDIYKKFQKTCKIFKKYCHYREGRSSTWEVASVSFGKTRYLQKISENLHILEKVY
jgi:hypothetical protein